MLKKILGEAPFDVFLSQKVVITPDKKTNVKLLFSNISEYDLPLSLKLNFSVSAEVDKTSFDLIVPADGKTECSLTFTKNPDSRIFTGKGIGEIEISDRIFDSKTLYEFEMLCEAAYKCTTFDDEFSPSDETLFTRDGLFYGNKGERLEIEVPLAEETKYRLRIISGSINERYDGDIINLSPGINRLSFRMEDDGSFFFEDIVSEEKIYPDTIGTKYFI